jgi:hypothetical protein
MTDAKSNNTNLKYFLFEIDEIRKLRDMCFPNRVEGKVNNLEFSWLRSVVLNKQYPLSPALVISSLEIGPEGTTDSSRPIWHLKLPENLDPEEVVSKWFHISDINITDNSIPQALHRLTIFTSLISCHPRTVQYANAFIEKTMEQHPDQKLHIDMSFFRDIWIYVYEFLLSATGKPSMTVSQYEIFKNYLFGTAMNYDGDVLDWIAYGFLVNVITQSSPGNKFPKIIPKLHPFVFLGDLLNNEINPLKTTIEEILNGIVIKTKGQEREGIILEKFFHDILHLRIKTLELTESKCTLGELIGMSKKSLPYQDAIDFSKIEYIPRNPNQSLPDSHKSPNKFFGAVNKIHMKPNTIRIQQVHRQEGFDLMLLYCDGNGEVHIVCMDFKSPLRDDAILSIDYRQGNYFLELRDHMAKKVSSLSKVGKCFAERSTLVYWSTNDFDEPIFANTISDHTKISKTKKKSFPEWSGRCMKFSESTKTSTFLRLRPVFDILKYCRHLYSIIFSKSTTTSTKWSGACIIFSKSTTTSTYLRPVFDILKYCRHLYSTEINSMKK